MKPQGGLPLPKEIGNTLTEAQIPTLDRLGAAAALGAAAGSGFKQLSHAGRILAGRQGANRAKIGSELNFVLEAGGGGKERTLRYSRPVHR
jgi:hypothetical protein